MQMMPKINWPQRVDSDAVARDEIASDVLVATVSSIPVQLIRAFRFAPQRLIGEASRDAFSSLTRFLHGGLNKTSVAWRMPGECPELSLGAWDAVPHPLCNATCRPRNGDAMCAPLSRRSAAKLLVAGRCVRRRAGAHHRALSAGRAV